MWRLIKWPFKPLAFILANSSPPPSLSLSLSLSLPPSLPPSPSLYLLSLSSLPLSLSSRVLSPISFPLSNLRKENKCARIKHTCSSVTTCVLPGQQGNVKKQTNLGNTAKTVPDSFFAPSSHAHLCRPLPALVPPEPLTRQVKQGRKQDERSTSAESLLRRARASIHRRAREGKSRTLFVSPVFPTSHFVYN